jgi:mannose-6-phosphate isomerase-like protein (cupin superfamily)
MEKVNIAEKLTHIPEPWNPHIVGEVQSMHVKLVKLKGEFIWHQHENEDEMFLVVKGRLLLKFRDRDIWLDEGEFLVIPRGVEHLPVAEEECHVMLFEPAGTLNTGNITDSERARPVLNQI